MRLSHALLSTLLFLTPTLAARSTATSFCKCICFNNSTIIALNPPSPSASHSALLFPRSPEDSTTGDPPTNPPHNHKLTCADCNRAFCLDHRLPICKAAKEEDVFATCFQRDSLKDEAVVILFLLATAGLLGWALVSPFIEKLRDRGRGGGVGGDGSYTRIPTPGSASLGSNTGVGVSAGPSSSRHATGGDLGP